MNLIFLDDIFDASTSDIEEQQFDTFQIECPHCEKTTTVHGGHFNCCVRQKCGRCGEELRVVPYKIFCSVCSRRIECLSTPTICKGNKRYWRRSFEHLAKFLWKEAQKDSESFIAVCIIVLALVGATSIIFFLIWLFGKITWFVIQILQFFL